MQDRFPQGCQIEIWELGNLGIGKARNLDNQGICSLGIAVEKHVFQTVWLITSQKFQETGLKLKAFILTFRDPSSHLCQKQHEGGCLNGFGVGELFGTSRIWIFQN